MVEVRFCAGICVLSFYLGVFEVSMGSMQIPNVVPNAQVFRDILHSLAYICIIVAINFNISWLHNKLSDNGISRVSGLVYQQCDAYKTYRWIFVLFILKPVMLITYKSTQLDDTGYTDDWLYVLVDNLLEFAILMGVIVAYLPFKPMALVAEVEALQVQSNEAEAATTQTEQPQVGNPNTQVSVQEQVGSIERVTPDNQRRTLIN